MYVLDTANPLGLDTTSIPNTPIHVDTSTPRNVTTVNGSDITAFDDLYCLDRASTFPGCGLLPGFKDAVTQYDYLLPDEKSTQGHSSRSYREHGYFVSGIIDHLAPKAPITIVRVLNDYGVGDIVSLIRGLSVVRSQSAGVVNMSLSVEPPPTCLSNLWGQWTSTWSTKGFTPGDDGVYRGMSQCPVEYGVFSTPDNTGPLIPLGLAITDLANAGYTLVSAAGNDSASGRRLGADLPAGFCGVKAVAARSDNAGANWSYSTDKNSLTDFSNDPFLLPLQEHSCANVDITGSQLPPTRRMAVGTTSDINELTARGVSVCSLFLPTLSGVARWQGTSFATAFISGNLAGGNLAAAYPNGVLPSPAPSLVESQPC